MTVSTQTPQVRAHRTGPRGEYQSSAAMRARLLTAGIDCLARHGYAGATTTLIQHAAGVSRGALLHHFPTRADLMLAIVRHVHALGDEKIRDRLDAYPPGRERFLALIGAVWEVMDEPLEVALVEIMVGARSDPSLAAPMTAILDEIHRSRTDQVWDLAASVGAVDRRPIETAVRLHLAALHGLSIEYLVTGDRPDRPADGDSKRAVTAGLAAVRNRSAASARGALTATAARKDRTPRRRGAR